jgi:hypothetical protein
VGDPLALGRYVRPWNVLPNGRQPIATHARMNSSKGLEKRPQHGLASSVSFQQAFGGPSPKRQRRERRLRTSWRRSRSGRSQAGARIIETNSQWLLVKGESRVV